MTFVKVKSQTPRFKVVAIAEKDGGLHQPYVNVAKQFLDSVANTQHFEIDYIDNTDNITTDFLANYQLFIQLNYPPYHWTTTAKAAFKDYIEKGKGGWIGFHHATLLGEFDGFKMWPWFSQFMGGIRFKNYISNFAAGIVHVEHNNHPIFKGIPKEFIITTEEWYTYDKDPRPNVEVLANVDENSYVPHTNITMGDHPVIWSNPKMKARNVYIFMGHHPNLFDNTNYKKLFFNAIFWAAHQSVLN
ncbi:ThuA domain-containing protein [Zhouia sp. PK063]|uniref:ThuA domain-containing protein n=1 Tax=Zhouia sp. PK063 TaxID=3373602 RepID=UPI0037AFBF0A